MLGRGPLVVQACRVARLRGADAMLHSILRVERSQLASPEVLFESTDWVRIDVR